MFSLNKDMRYFLCPGKTDMRKGINSLCGVIEQNMGHKVCHGDVFIFVSRNKKTVKLIHAEKSGIVLYTKYLEEGTFAMPRYDEDTKSFHMDYDSLKIMLEGIRADSNSKYHRLISLRRH